MEKQSQTSGITLYMHIQHEYRVYFFILFYFIFFVGGGVLFSPVVLCTRNFIEIQAGFRVFELAATEISRASSGVLPHYY